LAHSDASININGIRCKIEKVALRTSETNPTPFQPGKTDLFTINQKNTGRVIFY
jgi:hypothetical protein